MSTQTMSSNIVKCANCNIVINELLAFLHNVLDFMDEESIHQLCSSSFSEEEFIKAKTLLIDSLPDAKMPKRRKQGKKKMSRDLDDIISVLKSADPELLPVFVAKDLHKLPPVTFDHVDVTRLLKDILYLKNQLCTLKDRVVPYEEFHQLKKEVEHMKYNTSHIDDDTVTSKKINKKRGACLQNSFELNSEPMEHNELSQYVPIKSADSKVNGWNIPAMVASSPKTQRKRSIDTSSFMTYMKNNETEHVEAPTKVVFSNDLNDNESKMTCKVNTDVGVTKNRDRHLETTASTVFLLTPGTLNGQNCANNDTFASCTEALPSVNNCESEWKIVRKKSSKRNYKLIGQRGCASTAPDDKFRAADVKVPLFISNVSKETNENDIISYIKNKTSDSVTLKKIKMKQSKKYDAYKIYVSKCNLGLFLSDNFWPNGITFRRFFVRFTYNKQNNDASKL